MNKRQLVVMLSSFDLGYITTTHDCNPSFLQKFDTYENMVDSLTKISSWISFVVVHLKWKFIWTLIVLIRIQAIHQQEK